MTEKYMTISEIAEKLGITRSTLTAYRTRGRMPAPDLQYGRTPLWKPETIRKWRTTRTTA